MNRYKNFDVEMLYMDYSAVDGVPHSRHFNPCITTF